MASLGLISTGVTRVAMQADGKIVISGGNKGIARLNTDGSTDSAFNASANGTVSTLAVQADGKIVIGGSFTRVNGVACSYLARLNADGSLDTGFNASTGTGGVFTLAVQPGDGKIVVGGGFSQVNGVARAGIARLNADGSLDTSFNASTNGTFGGLVYTLAVQSGDGKIVLGGQFTQVNGAARNYVARLNADGSLDTSFNASADGTVSTLAVQPGDGKIVIVGMFSQVNGAARNGIARLNVNGSTDSAFNTSVNGGRVYTLAVQPGDGRIVLGGGSAYLARINADGSLDATFNASAAGSVRSVAVQADGKIVAGGIFKAFNGIAESGIVRLNADGSLDRSFVADVALGPNGLVLTLAVQADGKIVLGGQFTQVNGAARAALARFNADGSLDTGFNASTGSIRTLIVQPSDGKIIVGGYFAQINGVARAGIARLNADGSLDTDFNASASDVSALAVQADGKIVLGGQFTQVNGVARSNVARLNADGSLDTGFNASTNGRVSTLAVQSGDGKIVIGDSFTQVNGVARAGIARLNTDGSLDTGFNASAGGASTVAMQADGKIVISGGNKGIARLNTDGSTDSAFNASANGTVSTLAVQADGKIVIGGSFTQVNGAACSYLARLNADGSLDTGFNVGISGSSGTVFTLAVQPGDGRLVLGGDFTGVNGAVRNYLARLNADSSLDTGFVPGAGSPKLLALAVQPGDGNIVVGGSFRFAGGQFANALARLRPDGNLDRSFVAPFAPDDSVQALQPQPDNAVVTSALVSDTSPGSSPGSPDGPRLVSRRGGGSGEPRSRSSQPHAQSKIKNPIVRCSPLNGSFEPSFNPAAGTSGIAYCLGLQPADGKIIVGGDFALLNGEAGHPNLGRLDANGYLDPSFTATTDGTVRSVLALAGGGIVIGGDFTLANNLNRARLARLLADGSLDPAFNASAGTNGSVLALKAQSDGRLLVGGMFSTANGVSRSCLARLNTDGTLDLGFAPGAITLSGGGAQVASIDVQVDGKIIVAGLFDHVGAATFNKVARLNPDGSADTTYNPGGGPDAIVRAVALQPDGRALLGGDFTTVDSSERNAAARLLGDYDLNAYPALGQWRIINFDTPNATGNAADTAAPHGDGVPNLLKYALNMNAQAADNTLMTANGTKGLPLAGRMSEGKLSLTFVRRAAGTNPGITYSVEFADGLGAATAFAANAQAITSAPVAIDATWERVTVTDSVSSLNQPTRFVRLRVSAP